MNNFWIAVVALAFGLGLPNAYAQNYSTGAVNIYHTCDVGPDLPNSIEAASGFRDWYNLAGFPIVSRWENDNVFNTDFTDGPGKDMDPSGGSDVPNIYLFVGHGSCEAPPGGANDPDFLVTCSHGAVGFTDIGASSRWGNAGGRLQFAFIDASCPMDLVSLGHDWFPPFQGLHIATGHSGSTTGDTLNSPSRPSEFAARTLGIYIISIPGLPTGWIIIPTPVTQAWMDTGLIDVQDGVCAVAIANDETRDAAINRRDNEMISPAFGRPSGNWYAWRWVCK